MLSSVVGADAAGWPLRLWCAKEAVAKALGQGLVGGPRGLAVTDVDPDTGIVRVLAVGEMAARVPELDGNPMAAYTARESDWVAATAVHGREGSRGTGE